MQRARQEFFHFVDVERCSCAGSIRSQRVVGQRRSSILQLKQSNESSTGKIIAAKK
jgi:hypothetical protein